MAIPTRTSSSTPYSDLPSGRRPIVLAQLPHVGDDNRVAPPAPGPVAAEQAVPPEIAATSHFVDPGHQATHQSQSLSESGEDKTRRHSRRRRRRHSDRSESTSAKACVNASQPTGWGASLCQLHSQVTPYAGAIVTVALIVSAGLLYWMIVSPAQTPIVYQSIGQEGFDLNSVELPKFAPRVTPVPTDETTNKDLPWTDADQVAVETLPTALPQAQTLSPTPETSTPKPPSSPPETPVSLPAEEPTTNDSEAVSDGPRFPTTSHPDALDFAKIGAKSEDMPQEETAIPEPLPEVANRSVPNVSTPTKH